MSIAIFPQQLPISAAVSRGSTINTASRDCSYIDKVFNIRAWLLKVFPCKTDVRFNRLKRSLAKEECAQGSIVG